MGALFLFLLLGLGRAQDPPAQEGLPEATRLLQAGQAERAVAVLRRWCARPESPAQAWREAGRVLLLHQAAAHAVPFLEEASRRIAEDPETIGLLGSALLLSEQAFQAAEVLRAGTRRHPERADLWFQAGMSLAAAQRLKEASVCLEEALRRGPSDPVYRFWAGDLHLRLYQWKEAEQDLERAAAHPEEVPDAGWKLATVLARRGADQEAEALFRKVIGAEDREARWRACFHLGVFLFERQREAEALPLLQRVVKEVPTHRTAWGYLARCLQRLGRPDEARIAAGRAQDLQEEEDDLETRRLAEQIRQRLAPPAGRAPGR